jgi:hypothetical protein
MKSDPRIASVTTCADSSTTWSDCASPVFTSSSSSLPHSLSLLMHWQDLYVESVAAGNGARHALVYCKEFRLKLTSHIVWLLVQLSALLQFWLVIYTVMSSAFCNIQRVTSVYSYFVIICFLIISCQFIWFCDVKMFSRVSNFVQIGTFLAFLLLVGLCCHTRGSHSQPRALPQA